MKGHRFQYSRYALERMFQRGIHPDVIERIALDGQVIASYPDDQHYPSKLILGFENESPIHLMLADMPSGEEHIIITVYQPDPELWDATYTSKRSS